MRNRSFLTVLSLLAVLVFSFGCGDDDSPTESKSTVKSTRLEFYWQMNLDADAVDSVDPGNPVFAPQDFYFAYNSNSTPHGALSQAGGVEVAVIQGRSFESVTAADIAGVTFSPTFADSTYDAGRVILVRTDLDAVFKLGNLTETANLQDGVTIDYDRLTAAP